MHMQINYKFMISFWQSDANGACHMRELGDLGAVCMDHKLSGVAAIWPMCKAVKWHEKPSALDIEGNLLWLYQ